MNRKIATFSVFSIIAAMVLSGCEKNSGNDNNNNSNDNKPPVASFTITPLTGNTQTVFIFDASASTDEETSAADIQVRWDWNNDGTYDTDYSSTKTADHQYTNAGSYSIKLQVKDEGDSTATKTKNLTVDPYVDNCPDSFTDNRNGKTYNTVEIDNQCWMKENLDIGEMINASQSQQDNGTIEKYCYENNTANCDQFGGLYQWNEMMQYNSDPVQGICPEGWHLPSDVVWMQLEMALGMSYDEATSLGYRGTDEAAKLRTGGSSGFEVLLGGYRMTSPQFTGKDMIGTFFTASQSVTNPDNAYVRFIFDNNDKVYRTGYDKTMAMSVRCLKDSE